MSCRKFSLLLYKRSSGRLKRNNANEPLTLRDILLISFGFVQKAVDERESNITVPFIYSTYKMS